ncbi:hypothetical protein C7M84_021300 [Penaeus vannamei]|uniref:Uncharacterized protein n=1 Tax=Penaeus vannamei TaxID=6689 RepID=A0A3R7LWA9_PENVA|nr:hypothetical protein C7M84_021300 [Penaeus vannamei]
MSLSLSLTLPLHKTRILSAILALPLTEPCVPFPILGTSSSQPVSFSYPCTSSCTPVIHFLSLVTSLLTDPVSFPYLALPLQPCVPFPLSLKHGLKTRVSFPYLAASSSTTLYPFPSLVLPPHNPVFLSLSLARFLLINACVLSASPCTSSSTNTVSFPSPYLPLSQPCVPFPILALLSSQPCGPFPKVLHFLLTTLCPFPMSLHFPPHKPLCPFALSLHFLLNKRLCPFAYPCTSPHNPVLPFLLTTRVSFPLISLHLLAHEALLSFPLSLQPVLRSQLLWSPSLSLAASSSQPLCPFPRPCTSSSQPLCPFPYPCTSSLTTCNPFPILTPSSSQPCVLSYPSLPSLTTCVLSLSFGHWSASRTRCVPFPTPCTLAAPHNPVFFPILGTSLAHNPVSFPLSLSLSQTL